MGSKSRRFIALGIAGALVLGSMAGCGDKKQSSKSASSSDGSIELKIGVSTGETDPRNIAAQAFADEIAEKTNGALTAKVYPAGELGGDADMIDALAMGAGKVDIVISDASNFAQYETTMGISAMPFIFNDFDTAWAFMDSDIEAGVEEKLIDDNIRVLSHYCNGFRCVTNSNGPINSPEDMNGLLIRTPENPIFMATMVALNANPQPLPFSELYAALEQGTYDAQENPIPVIYNNKLYEVQKYLSVTNHIYSGMCFSISENVWQSLNEEQQEIVKSAAESSAESDRNMNREQTEDLISKLEEVGMEINYPDIEPFAEVTSSVIEDNAATYGDVIDQLKEWKESH